MAKRTPSRRKTPAKRPKKRAEAGQVITSNLALHELFQQQAAAILDNADITEEPIVTSIELNRDSHTNFKADPGNDSGDERKEITMTHRNMIDRVKFVLAAVSVATPLLAPVAEAAPAIEKDPCLRNFIFSFCLTDLHLSTIHQRNAVVRRYRHRQQAGLDQRGWQFVRLHGR